VARRKFNVFSLSFLDCICCGFGAVILLFVLMNAQSARNIEEKTVDLRGEVDRIEVEVLKMEKEKVLARNSLDEVIDELAKTEGLSREIIRELSVVTNELADMEGQTLATKEHVNKLKTDLLSLEEGLKRLKAGAMSVEPGNDLRAFAGDGTRQYLTGLRLKGNHTLVLVDASASMLAPRLVDVLRIRNLPPEEQRKAPKWMQARRTVDWLLAKLPEEGSYQIVLYGEEARPLLADRPGWWPAADPTIREEASKAFAALTPAGGTSLHLAFDWAAKLTPRPDNIILLADGLPTMDRGKPTVRRAVNGRRRLGYFAEAAALLPGKVPVNTLLFQMEGDPMAAVSYWRLAVDTRGSFMSIAEDWP
jgi:hypothetical protein